VTWEDFGTKNKTLNEVIDIDVSCKSARIERNDYTEADTVRLTIDYSAFPFDPRCIRACGITVFMEDVKSRFDKNGKPTIIRPNDLPIEAEASNKVFIGFADESSIKLDSDNKTVELEGRDYTGLFIDIKRLNSDPIPLSKPIDQIIKELIHEQENTKNIEVINRTGETLPTLAKLAPDFNEATSVKNQHRKETYWEIIQDILGRVALIGFIELDKFIINKPQNIYEKKNIKHFIWGKNIKDISFKRKLGRAKDFNVKVVSFNPLEKKVETVLIPKEATHPLVKGPEVTIPQLDKNGKKIEPPKTADYITFSVKDVTNKEQLIKIGESIFLEMSRQQIEGELSTFEMAVPEENKKLPIKFNEMRNGSAIRVFFSSDEMGQLNSNSDEKTKRNFLIKRGYPNNVATAFAKSLDKINTAFYVKSVSFEMDRDNGFSMKINFINFIDLDSSLMR
jgi:hypothetical protein